MQLTTRSTPRGAHPVDVGREVDRRGLDREVLVGDRDVKAPHHVGHPFASLFGAAHVVGEDPDLLGVELLGQVRGLRTGAGEIEEGTLGAEQARPVSPVRC